MRRNTQLNGYAKRVFKDFLVDENFFCVFPHDFHEFAFFPLRR